MAHLERMRQLRRDPAAPAGPYPPPPLPGGTPEIDPSGHTFSPSLRMQQKELNAKMAEVPDMAAKARDEFEARVQQVSANTGATGRGGGGAPGRERVPDRDDSYTQRRRADGQHLEA